MFNDLKSFSFRTWGYENFVHQNIVLGLKKLEKLKLSYTADFKNIFQTKLLTELPELKIIIVSCARRNENMIFNQFLVSEWKQIEMERYHTIKEKEFIFKWKFQRI